LEKDKGNCSPGVPPDLSRSLADHHWQLALGGECGSSASGHCTNNKQQATSNKQQALLLTVSSSSKGRRPYKQTNGHNHVHLDQLAPTQQKGASRSSFLLVCHCKHCKQVTFLTLEASLVCPSGWMVSKQASSVCAIGQVDCNNKPTGHDNWRAAPFNCFWQQISA